MKTIKTKQELEQWIIAANNAGYTVPCVINGGGFSWIRDWEYDIKQTGKSLTEDEDYDDEVEYIKKGKEYEDFRYFMTEEQYESTTFIRVRHYTGYNQENFEYQFGIYEILEIDE